MSLILLVENEVTNQLHRMEVKKTIALLLKTISLCFNICVALWMKW